MPTSSRPTEWPAHERQRVPAPCAPRSRAPLARAALVSSVSCSSGKQCLDFRGLRPAEVVKLILTTSSPPANATRRSPTDGTPYPLTPCLPPDRGVRGRRPHPAATAPRRGGLGQNSAQVGHLHLPRGRRAPS